MAGTAISKNGEISGKIADIPSISNDDEFQRLNGGSRT
jgi:hypothetical protein